MLSLIGKLGRVTALLVAPMGRAPVAELVRLGLQRPCSLRYTIGCMGGHCLCHTL